MVRAGQIEKRLGEIVGSRVGDAVCFKDRSVGYDELESLISSYLQDLGGLGEGRVLLLLPDSIESYLSHLALFLAEVCVVPLSPQAKPKRIAAIIDQFEPDLVLTTKGLFSRHKQLFEGRRVCSLGVETEGARVSRVVVSELQSAQEPRGRHGARISSRYVIFTSGTTGEPKGVCLGETTILSAARMMVGFLGLDSSRCSLVTVPLFDYYGMIQIFGHLLAGSRFRFGVSTAFRGSFFEALSADNWTDLVAVPFGLKQMVEHAQEDPSKPLSDLKYITSSSDHLTNELLGSLFELNGGVRVVNIYGLTEAGRAVSNTMTRDSFNASKLGGPSQGVLLEFDKKEDGAHEIILAGPNLMLGYLLAIENGDTVFEPVTEIRTGDLARQDEHGDWVLVGREDHMINWHGSKIQPAEIEEPALRLPFVRDARVVIGECSESGENCIQLEIVGALDENQFAELQSRLKSEVPSLFIPHCINLVDSIARSEIGSKVLR